MGKENLLALQFPKTLIMSHLIYTMCVGSIEVTEFKYLGSTVQSDGGNDKEVRKRIQAGWNSWQKSTGLLCNNRVPLKVKGKIYRTMVRPAMLYGMETVPLTAGLENRMDTAEMRMLRWSLAVTRRDMLRNEVVRDRLKVGVLSQKIKESRLMWYGHVERREEDYFWKRVLRMEIPGRRKRERPRRRWMDNIKADMLERGLQREDTQDRAVWRSKIRCGDPC